MEYTATKDLGFKETFDKWNGKFLTEESYDEVVTSKGVDADIIKIYKPHASAQNSNYPKKTVTPHLYLNAPCRFHNPSQMLQSQSHSCILSS